MNVFCRIFSNLLEIVVSALIQEHNILTFVCVH